MQEMHKTPKIEGKKQKLQLICEEEGKGAAMAQWRERSPSTNVAWARFPDPSHK